MTSDEALLARVEAKALAYDRHSGCSQSVLLALQEELGMGDLESFKTATVLSGGVALRGETCGALLGALMGLGLAAGRDRMEDTEQYRQAMGPAGEICDAFMQGLVLRFGMKEQLTSTLCRDIQTSIYGRSFDLNNTEDFKAFLCAGGHSDEGGSSVCGVAARVAADRILKIRRGVQG